MALDKFVNCTYDLLDLEREYNQSTAEGDIHSLEVLRVKLDSLWSQVKKAYEKCRDTKEGSKENKSIKISFMIVIKKVFQYIKQV